ncbi:TIGR03619 family F420-dependent LLM class oxidoreductase [Luedemannella helvata]|uniref:Luciferase-like domain-containing protein n=1 Tax=Luedemannella helvata TaxID=349315 RepID=A0ABP4VUZ0_9ACTN
MEVGLQLPHLGEHATPSFVRDFAQAAEELGFDGLWAADHVAVPRRIRSAYTLAGGRPPEDGALSAVLGGNLECLTTLAYVAAVTRRVKLGTSVAVLPLRHPLLNAAMLASLDAYCDGRLWFGVGAGWLREEAEALQMPWDRRGARMDEHLELLRRMWSEPGDYLTFHGTFYDVEEIDVRPRPARPGGPPILVGGHSASALDRAGRLGHGWIASRITPAELAAGFATVRETARRHGRDPATLRLHANVDFSPRADLRRFAIVSDAVAKHGAAAQGVGVSERPEEIVASLRAYAGAGVHHLKVSARMATAEAELAWLRLLAREVLPALRGGSGPRPAGRADDAQRQVT